MDTTVVQECLRLIDELRRDTFSYREEAQLGRLLSLYAKLEAERRACGHSQDETDEPLFQTRLDVVANSF